MIETGQWFRTGGGSTISRSRHVDSVTNVQITIYNIYNIFGM